MFRKSTANFTVSVNAYDDMITLDQIDNSCPPFARRCTACSCSGGLDTSTVLVWLIEQGYDVVAYCANLGQEEDYEAARQKALKVSCPWTHLVHMALCYCMVARGVICSYISPSADRCQGGIHRRSSSRLPQKLHPAEHSSERHIRKPIFDGNVTWCVGVLRFWSGQYMRHCCHTRAALERHVTPHTLAARPCISKRAVEIAHKEGCQFVAHGATGKGNDQVRFELSFASLDPTIQAIVPWRDPTFYTRFQGRSDLIEYASARGVPVVQTKVRHDSFCGGVDDCGGMEDAALVPWESYKMDRGTAIQLAFAHSAAARRLIQAKPYSMDENMFHISYEAGILEDPVSGRVNPGVG